MPVSFHNAASERMDIEQFPSTAGGTMMATVNVKIAGQLRTFASLISSGVAASYPKLRFVIVEGGIGWIAAVIAPDGPLVGGSSSLAGAEAR